MSSTISQSLLKLMSTESVMLSNYLILCRLLCICLQSFPASVSFPVSQLFASGGQSIGASASASVLSMNIQDWFPLGLTCLIPIAVQGTLKRLLQHHNSKASIFLQMTQFNFFLWLNNIPLYIIPHLYRFFCWRTCRLFPCPGYCK